MLILGVDTSSIQGSLCLLDDSKLLSYLQWTKEGSHSELLTDKLTQVLSESNRKITDIKKIYCGIGPGSFTGIRVGVSFAKSIAFSYGLKITPVNSLLALAISSNEDGEITSLIDAQKNALFFSHFKKESSDIKIYQENKMVTLDKLKNIITKENICCGDGYSRYESFLDPKLKSLLKFSNENKFMNLSQVIQWDLKTKKLLGLPWREVQPFYIRPSSAEEKLNQKTH